MSDINVLAISVCEVLSILWVTFKGLFKILIIKPKSNTACTSLHYTTIFFYNLLSQYTGFFIIPKCQFLCHIKTRNIETQYSHTPLYSQDFILWIKASMRTDIKEYLAIQNT